ncbi:MAG: low temperature requirement protein A [Fimbriimonadaceae bacterium]
MLLGDRKFKPPTLRDHDETPERHATWLELFFDLAFVAVLGQISVNLAKSHDFNSILIFFGLFVPIWWSWVGQVFFQSRFDADDLSHRVATFVQIVILGLMATMIPKAFAGDPTGFALSYTAMRGVLILQYLLAGHYISAARVLTSRYSMGFSIAAGFWIASVFIPQPFNYLFWAIGIFFDFLTPNLCAALNIEFPPHPGHTPERFGLFTIIVLGEAIIATVGTLSGVSLNKPGMVAAILGLLLACAVWWVYFEGVGAADQRVPKSENGVVRYRSWLYGHLPLHAGIILMAVGVERVILQPINPLSGYEPYLLPCSVGVVMVMMHVFNNSSVSREIRRENRKYIRPHFFVTALILPVFVLASSLTPLAILSLCFFIFLSHVLLNIRGYPASMESAVANQD